MDDNLKRKFSGSDQSPDTAIPMKRVSIPTLKRSGNVIGMDCAPQELSSLSKDLEEAFENPRFADVTLRVGADEFPAHKIILVSRSKWFEGMFASNMKESKENIVNLVDVKASTVKAILQYMYTGKADEMFIDEVIDLYAAADRYGLLGLKNHCKNFIVKEIDEESIRDVAVLGDLHCDEELTMAAKCMLKKNPKRIFENQKWRGFSEEYPGIYSKLVESTMMDLTDEVEQSNSKCTADELLTKMFPPIQRPQIPNPSNPSSNSSSLLINFLMLANQRIQTLNRQNPPIQDPENPPIQDPENPPIQDPENPPIQDPENPPIQDPENPPIQDPENPPIQDPENPPVQDPQIPPILLDMMRLFRNRQNPPIPNFRIRPIRNPQNPLIRNPQNPPIRNPQNPLIQDPRIPLIRYHQNLLFRHRQNPPFRNRQNPMFRNRQNPLIQDPENPPIRNPRIPTIPVPENPPIPDPQNFPIQDPQNLPIQDPQNLPIQDPQNLPIQDPQDPPIQDPQDPSIVF